MILAALSSPSLSFKVKLGLSGSSLGRAKEKWPLAKLSISAGLMVWITWRRTAERVMGSVGRSHRLQGRKHNKEALRGQKYICLSSIGCRIMESLVSP